MKIKRTYRNTDTSIERHSHRIVARNTTTIFDTASVHERIENKPPIVRFCRRFILGTFNLWSRISLFLAKKMNWFERVEPYVGYGTDDFSRLICRTVYASSSAKPRGLTRGIRSMLAVAAPHIPVKIDIDGIPLATLQVGSAQFYDKPLEKNQTQADYAFSDRSGYLDLIAQRSLTPGIHKVTYKVRHRAPQTDDLYTISSRTTIGIISDVDDTIMITQAPSLWKAAYNLLLLNPIKRAPVPGMNVFFNKIADLFPEAPFFYLSTSPWNVESSIRRFIKDQGYPLGPLLLRDLDPRPKTFVPNGVQHKLEFAEQLMSDFPNMKFILIGDDGQKDPTTYATIARRYPHRILAIAIRQLSPKESAFTGALGTSLTQPIPVTDAPVFTGTTGSNLLRTMLPYLEQFAPTLQKNKKSRMRKK